MIRRRTSAMLTAILTAACALGIALATDAAAETSGAAAQTSSSTAPAPAKKPAAPSQKRFPSAEKAVEAFIVALRAGNTSALLGIFGSDARSLVSSGDPVADRRTRMVFLKAYEESNQLVARDRGTIILVGSDGWPFPIPLVQDRRGWRFDTRQGREEILARRIGRNETNAVQTCLAYVDAQREYYAADRAGDGILEYARKFASTPGKRDGLYWATRAGELPSPLGPLIERARAEGYRRAKGGGPTPYHGYLYRILTAQGLAAPDCAYDYIVRGHMIAGFGLVAFPARYGASGVMTFTVNQDGIVYQKDLGPSTRKVATAMKAFDPDTTWTKVEAATLVADHPTSEEQR